MAGQRTVFFISDRTGITAEMLGNSLLTQFEDFRFQRVTIPFVDSPAKIAEAVRQVNATAAAQGRRPIVVSSVVDEAMSETEFYGGPGNTNTVPGLDSSKPTLSLRLRAIGRGALRKRSSSWDQKLACKGLPALPLHLNGARIHPSASVFIRAHPWLKNGWVLIHLRSASYGGRVVDC